VFVSENNITFRPSSYFLWSNDFDNQQHFVWNILWLIVCYWWEGRPVGTGGILGQCPPNFFCAPPTFIVSRKICLYLYFAPPNLKTWLRTCGQVLSPFWLDNRDMQGRNEVRWRLRQETSLPPPCSNLRSFGSKCFEIYCFEKSAYDIVGTFWLPAVIRCPGNCDYLPPSLRLWCYAIKIGKYSESKQIFKYECHEHLQFSNTIRHVFCFIFYLNKAHSIWIRFVGFCF